MEEINGSLRDRFQAIRDHSLRICRPLEVEDFVVQSMADVSPMRWHLAHTTWFFETFVLRLLPGYRPASEAFEYLFNSYYNTVGEQYPRERRGLLSRPTVKQVLAYRSAIDDQMMRLLGGSKLIPADLASVVEVGLQHEQQHQELMLTDIKHVLSCNPLLPAYVEGGSPAQSAPTQAWRKFDDGVVEIGFAGDGFSFDNETPRHRVFLEPFSLSNRLVTNGEFLAFIEQGGYQRPEFWLALGWHEVQEKSWTMPIYWSRDDDAWYEFTLGGKQTLDLEAPVVHLSYFEAEAFARWSQARLPTESEWEHAAKRLSGDAFTVSMNAATTAEERLEQGELVHPAHGSQQAGFSGLFGSVWQWTASSYSSYPGYQPLPGALGEYNGKFMCNQYVLRGSSCATSHNHHRTTYRNFFPPPARWQFSGVRLARSTI